MSLYIKEYLGSEITTSNYVIPEINFKESMENNFTDLIDKKSIMQDIEGLHVGPTMNFTWYTLEALESSKKSWTAPYEKPLIMHHNDKDGVTIGRIKSTEMKYKNTRSNTPALLFTCKISDKDGIEQVLDGRLKTTSVGIIATDVRCSICGEQISLDEYGNSECGHIKGNVYNGKTCYWMIYEMQGKELSYVIVPSDIYAHNIRTYTLENKTLLQESEDLKMDKINIKESLEQKEATVIEEKVPEGDNKVEDPELIKLQNENKTLKENIENLNKEIKTLKATASIVEEMKKVLKEKEVEVEKEKVLRESLEDEMKEYRVQIKESLVSEIINLRESLGRPKTIKENLEKRSNEFLKYTLQDLKEDYEIKNKENVEIKESEEVAKNIKVTEAADPTIQPEEKKIEKENVKENKTVGNISVKESLEDCYDKLFK